MEIKLDGMSRLERLQFVIVNSFTSFNLFIGLLSLLVAATGSIQLAAWGILLCVFLDGCDGLLARRWDVTSDFGTQLDSLADMTSFIIASGALAYYWVVSPSAPIPLIVIAGASGLYVIAGAFRLARFNTTSTQPGYFQGLPTTGVAGVIAVNTLLYPAMNSYWVVALVTLLAVLMVSLFPYPKFSSFVSRCPRGLFPLLLAAAFVNLSGTLLVLMVIYLGSGPVISLSRRLRTMMKLHLVVR